MQLQQAFKESRLSFLDCAKCLSLKSEHGVPHWANIALSFAEGVSLNDVGIPHDKIVELYHSKALSDLEKSKTFLETLVMPNERITPLLFAQALWKCRGLEKAAAAFSEKKFPDQPFGALPPIQHQQQQRLLPQQPPPAAPLAPPPPKSYECAVCLEAPKQVILRPCKHLCVCANCSARLSKCPICMAHIEVKETVYLS